MKNHSIVLMFTLSTVKPLLPMELPPQDDASEKESYTNNITLPSLAELEKEIKKSQNRRSLCTICNKFFTSLKKHKKEHEDLLPVNPL